MNPNFRWARLCRAAMIAGLTWLVAAPAWSQPEQFYHAAPRGEMWGGHPMSKAFEELKVTPAQREQIKQIEAKMMTDARPIHQDHRELMHRAVQLLLSPTIDEAAIEKNRQEMLALHARLSEHMTSAFVQMAKVLTPDQRGQLAVHMKARIDRMGRHLGLAQPPSAASAPASGPAR
jgi:Spy/CpxP family protein refolding chaperone